MEGHTYFRMGTEVQAIDLGPGSGVLRTEANNASTRHDLVSPRGIKRALDDRKVGCRK